MTTKEIYERYDVPKNLRQHMLRVAGLAEEIRAHWIGEPVDWETTVQAALLHDLANVIKFDFNFSELLGEEELPRVDHWRAKQQELIKKYGDDEHAATEAMLVELGVSDRVRGIVSRKSFGNVKEVNASSDMPTKILLYCDLRALPTGLGTLQARIDDIALRMTKYSTRPDFPELMAAWRATERPIAANVKPKLDEFITEPAIDRHREQLLAHDI